TRRSSDLSMGPAAESMVNRFGLDLTVIDPGWPVAATIGWGTPIVPFVVIGIILLNILLLFLNLTKTVNIDIFNFWIYMITGALIYTLTHNIVIATIASMIHFVVSLVIVDLTGTRFNRSFNFK